MYAVLPGGLALAPAWTFPSMVPAVGAHGFAHFLIYRFETGYSSDQDDPLPARARGIVWQRQRVDHGIDLPRIAPVASLLKLLRLTVFLPHDFLSLRKQVFQLAHFIGHLSELSFQYSALPPTLGGRCQPPLQCK